MKLSLLSLFILFASLFAFQPTLAFNPFCTTDSSGTCVSGPCKDSPTSAACQQAANQNGSGGGPVVDTINTAANIIAIITGIAGVIMIIIGGFTLVTSGGNTESVTTARRRIIYSLVGMVIVALAWVITRFITDKLIQ